MRSIVIVLLLTATALADGWPGLNKETIGKIGSGTKADDAIKILGKPTKQPKAEQEAATGEWAAEWTFPNDATVWVSGKSAKGPFVVRSIDIKGKNTLKTAENLGIGSKLADVKKAYGKYLEGDGDSWHVGDAYFALVFTVDKDVVTGVFYGATGAE